MKPPKKFTLSTPARNTMDSRGTVQIKIQRVFAESKVGHHVVKGNISKTMTFRDARVSEVFLAIKTLLAK